MKIRHNPRGKPSEVIRNPVKKNMDKLHRPVRHKRSPLDNPDPDWKREYEDWLDSVDASVEETSK